MMEGTFEINVTIEPVFVYCYETKTPGRLRDIISSYNCKTENTNHSLAKQVGFRFFRLTLNNSILALTSHGAIEVSTNGFRLYAL